MNDELSAIPKFRVTGNEFIDTGVGIAAPPGSIFESLGWPKSDSVEPLNEPARRVLRYWKENSRAPSSAYPPSPWSSTLNRIHLPHLGGRDTVNAISETSVRPHMPAYKALADVDEKWNERKLFRNPVHKGDIVRVLAWPEALFAVGRFKPANAEARAVADYYDEAREHPLLPISPWDWLEENIHLPPLPAVEKWGVQYPAVRGTELEAA